MRRHDNILGYSRNLRVIRKIFAAFKSVGSSAVKRVRLEKCAIAKLSEMTVQKWGEVVGCIIDRVTPGYGFMCSLEILNILAYGFLISASFLSSLVI